MAITGIVLVLFIIGHLLGNLQIFAGYEAFNAYAEFLHSKPALIWAARIVVFIAFVLHVTTAFQLRAVNTEARPVSYTKEDTVQATIASRSMMVSGVLLLIFIVFHLLHFTFGKVLPEHFDKLDPVGHHDIYSIVILSFQNNYIAGTYVIIMVLLGLHLSHGLSSIFQTLGFNHPKYTPLISKLGVVIAWLFALAFISIPVAVKLCLLQPL